MLVTEVGLEGYRQCIPYMLPFRRGVVIFGCPRRCLYLQAQYWGITLRDKLLWFYGSDNIGQGHRCPFRFYGDLTSQNADGQLNVKFSTH